MYVVDAFCIRVIPFPIRYHTREFADKNTNAANNRQPRLAT